MKDPTLEARLTGRLEGKVAFITGAARGQGRCHAVRMAAEGARVIGVDICQSIPGVEYPGATEEDLQRTEELVKETGQQMLSHVADVRNLSDLEAAVEAGVEAFGRLDIIVANAGIGQSPSGITETPPSIWRDMIDINLTGVWNSIRAAVPHMVSGNRGGSIVITSSAAGLKAYANIGAYSAAKHGLVGLMRTLALELAPHSIRVNSIHPTQVATPMLLNDTIFKLFVPDIQNPTQDDFAKASAAANALPVAWVESDDIANAVLFLTSDEGRYVTGVALPLDAGTTIK